MGPAETCLAEVGLQIGTIQVDAHPGLVDYLDANPGLLGTVAVQDVIEGQMWHIEVRPGLPADQRERFAAWTLEKVVRFLEHGPEPGGWAARTSTSGWQLWCRQVALPPLD